MELGSHFEDVSFFEKNLTWSKHLLKLLQKKSADIRKRATLNIDENKEIEKEQESFVVDCFRPEDADGIVDLFRSVYGEHYPVRLFYDPASIRAANQEGSCHSICARSASGKIIGVQHLYLSAPCKFLYETGAGLILKEYRNSGANRRLLDFLYNDFTPRNTHIEELFGEAVCNHPYMQKTVLAFNFVETAIEIALMPAEAYSKEKSAAGRVATVNCSRCYKPKPHRIFLPPVYELELQKIYGRLGDTRDMVMSVEDIPRGKATDADLTLFEFARVARIFVNDIGGDFRCRLFALESEALAKNTLVFQVWLKLTDPSVGKVVDILREDGYFFGGPVPRWFDGDALLMQKLLCPPDFESIVLSSDVAKELLKFIRGDCEK